MDRKIFNIEVPSGNVHQAFASLFVPRGMPSATHHIYISTELLMAQKSPFAAEAAQKCIAKVLNTIATSNSGEFVDIASVQRPVIVCGDMSILQSADFFGRKFHDLHWIGVTPDRIIRNVSKVINVELVEYDRKLDGNRVSKLILRGVKLNSVEISAAIEQMELMELME